MKIIRLTANNINNLTVDVDSVSSIGVGGLSGSGKSTFCATLYAESTRRIISLLPKSEYRFLFPDCLSTNYSANNIEKMPLVFYLRKAGFASNPRSTLGTHSGIFKKIRIQFADRYGKASEFFSFNNSIMWCPDCKGRGSSAGVECKTCKGSRYNDAIRKYTLSIAGKEMSIIDVNKMTMRELLENSECFDFDEIDIKKMNNTVNLGLPYLSLERVMSTLSGGETLRTLLSEFMASCDGALIILDEISTGLDKLSLLQVLKEISTLAENNQVWFIDHSDMVLFSSNKQIYFGPGSGDKGGHIVLESPRPAEVYPEKSAIVVSDYYCFKDLSKRNIEIEAIKIPKGAITAITGESGCGKSTLVNECILPYFHKNYKSVALIVIGQDRNQSITSKSTISSFLDIKKYLKKYDASYYNLNLAKACEALKKDKRVYSVLKMLVDLGLGYLTLDRKIQTLSTGEFQCIHLVSKIVELEKKEMVIVLDEPSKGLSQNILNLFMSKIRSILSDYNATIFIIEHNEYVLNCSDFIIDFGKRTDKKVTTLEVKNVQEWRKNRKNILLTKLRFQACL